MNLIRFALRKPIAIMVVVLTLAFFSYNTIKKINVDIFPEVELPAMYIAMPYGGSLLLTWMGLWPMSFKKYCYLLAG